MHFPKAVVLLLVDTNYVGTESEIFFTKILCLRL